MLPIVEWKDGNLYAIYAPFSMVELGRYGNKAVLTGSRSGFGFGDSIFWVGFLTWGDDQGTDGKFSHQTVATAIGPIGAYGHTFAIKATLPSGSKLVRCGNDGPTFEILATDSSIHVASALDALGYGTHDRDREEMAAAILGAIRA